MKCFQILNDEVLIINEGKQYSDTTANFAKDGGSVPEQKIIYDDQQQCCVVNDKFLEYPCSDYDAYIDGIDKYIAAKAVREYVPPTFEELKAQALSYQYQLYEAQKHAIAWLEDGSGYGFDTGNDDQNNWQVALTLMDNDVTMYRVYTDKNNLQAKSFLQVTRQQMMEAGKICKAQQYAAYAGFEQVKAYIDNAKTKDELQLYLPAETA